MVPFGMKNKKVILASASPRRKMLMEGLDIRVEVINVNHEDESYPREMPPEEIPAYLAAKKADAARDRITEDTVLLTADTIVLLDGEVIEKPRDADHARQMLARLSGRKHRVLTGVCMRSRNKEVCFTAASDVFFGKLSEEEIDYYVSTYKPFDKAGAYGIQEWIGYVSVERIEGSFYNVMGLPVHQVWQYLKEF